MKKAFFYLLAGLIPAMMVTKTGAQNSVNTELLEPQKNSAAIAIAVSPAADAASTTSFVSARVLKNFTRKFKSINGATWEKNKEGFAAKFTLNGVKHIVYYGRGGSWNGSLKNYTEDNMPRDVRSIVKREYFDYIITFVQEVETIQSEGKPTFIIHLEDKNQLKMVRICDGEMNLWKEYKKQSQ